MPIPVLARRGVGAMLLALALLPWYRWVASRGTGPAALQTLRLGGLYLGALWLGVVLSAAGAVALSRLLRPGPIAAIWRRIEGALLGPRSGWFAAVLALLATAASLWVGTVVLDGQPALLDGIAQRIQARYLAAGRLAGPPLQDAAFWQFQFMVLTDAGWVSQYPPGFAAVLALGERLGAPWLAGPLLLGASVGLASLIAERLFPEDRIVARGGAALAALSPFLVFHAGASMNHSLALALAATAIYAGLRAVAGGWAWSLLAGAALGGLCLTRPYAAVVMASVVAAAAWAAARGGRGCTARGWAVRVAGAAAGAAPFVLALLLYNRRMFGAATRFGYAVAEGPGHGPGFHLDPWGDPYGFREAVGYTAADLQGLSLELLRSPVPVLVIVALYLLLARRLIPGAGAAAAWALLPVAAHAFYWHHDLFMGPRLLYEAAPGWCLLLAAAVASGLRALPEAGAPPGRAPVVSRSGAAGVLMLGLVVAVTYSAPQKLASYGSAAERSGMAATPPAVGGPALVFVHGSWEDRIAARLAASGMRVDSVRAALRYNGTCRLELALERLGTGPRGAAGLALADPTLAFGPGAGPPLRELRMPSGSVIRSPEGEALDPACARQAGSDFRGVLGLPPFLWQGDLPGLGTGGAMFVRDLGPERNARLLGRFPDRAPGLLVRRGGEVRLLPYEEAIAEVWGTAKAAARP